jgi:glycerophosphoryl diester phosphodiesterase
VIRRRFLAASAAFFVALTAVAAAPVQAATDPPGCPRIVAHATSRLVAPENTVAGISATAAGVSMVEMDVRWSANANTQANPGYPVLMHDATLDRTTNGTGNVDATGLTAMTHLSAAAYAPWQSNPAYGGFHPDGSPVTAVPWAWEFINASSAANVDMLLDVKVTPGEWGARKLMQYVDQFAYRDHLVYMGSPASVTAMRSWFPSLDYLVIEYPPAGMIRTGESLLSLGADGYAVPYDRITPAAVAYWKAYGLQVYTWTSDSAAIDVAANWAAVSAAGVDALITDRPAAALAWQAPLCAAPPTTAPTTPPTTVVPTEGS